MARWRPDIPFGIMVVGEVANGIRQIIGCTWGVEPPKLNLWTPELQPAWTGCTFWVMTGLNKCHVLDPPVNEEPWDSQQLGSQSHSALLQIDCWAWETEGLERRDVLKGSALGQKKGAWKDDGTNPGSRGRSWRSESRHMSHRLVGSGWLVRPRWIFGLLAAHMPVGGKHIRLPAGGGLFCQHGLTGDLVCLQASNSSQYPDWQRAGVWLAPAPGSDLLCPAARTQSSCHPIAAGQWASAASCCPSPYGCVTSSALVAWGLGLCFSLFSYF